MTPVARALALIGPLAVAGSWWTWIAAADDDVAAVPLHLPDTAGAEILIVGNSQARAAVDTVALAERLEVEGRVELVHVPSGYLPAIYPLLKHRLLAADPPPDLLILPMTLAHLLTVQKPLPAVQAAIDTIVPTPDPEVTALVFNGWRWIPGERALGRAAVRREALISSLTRLAAPGDDPAARMAAARRAALGGLDDAAMVARADVVPAMAHPDAHARGEADPNTTLLPALVKLAADRGVQLVIVTVPEHPAGKLTHADEVRTFAAWAEANGVAFGDLRAVPVSLEAWRDRGHVTAAGQVVYTEQLAAALRVMGAGDDAPLRSLPPPVEAPKVRRTPETDVVILGTRQDGCTVGLRTDLPAAWSDGALLQRGLGAASPVQVWLGDRPLTPHRAAPKAGAPCDGSFLVAPREILVQLPEGGRPDDLRVTWPTTPLDRRLSLLPDDARTDPSWALPPGAALTWDWPSTPPLARGAVLRLVAAVLTPGTGAVTLSAGAGGAALTTAGDLAWAEIPLPDQPGPLQVTLQSAADAPGLLVQAFVIAHPAREEWLVGRADQRFDRVPLLSAADVRVSGIPAARALPGTPTAAGRHLQLDVGPPHDALTVAALHAATGDAGFRCLPFELGPVGEAPLRQHYPTQHRAGRLTVPAPAGAGPFELRTWADRRTCQSRTWIDPGATLTTRSARTTSMRVPARHLHLPLAALPADAPGEVRVQLTLDGVVVLDHRTPAGQLADGPLNLPIDPPLPTPLGAVTLSITSPEGAWLLGGVAELRGDADRLPAWLSRP